jgi:hypothetical protein
MYNVYRCGVYYMIEKVIEERDSEFDLEFASSYYSIDLLVILLYPSLLFFYVQIKGGMPSLDISS